MDISKLEYKSNNDTWWMSQGEKIFVCLGVYFLGEGGGGFQSDWLVKWCAS